MRKIVAFVLSMVMFSCLLAACGKSTDEVEKPKEAEKEKETSEMTLDSGFWVLEKMKLDGAEFSGEDMEAIYGPAENIMVLAFGEDGIINGVYFEDYIKGTYSGNLEKFEIELMEEKISGTSPEEKKIEITFSDESSFTLVNQNEMPEVLAENPWLTYLPEFDAEKTCAMSNFMNYGRYIVEEDTLYGLTHSNGSMAVGATPFYMKGDFPEFEETKILDDRGSACYLCENEDYLYYTLDNMQVCRIQKDGTGLEVLYEGVCDYLQIHEDKLYFTDENYHFVSTDLNGENLKKVVEKEIYYPYFICSDWMVFQDDADDESLHLYNITHGTEMNITYVPSYNPIMDGKYLYYYDKVDGEQYFNRIDMSDPSVFRFEGSEQPWYGGAILIDEKYIYTTNNNSVLKEDWKELSDDKDNVSVCEVYVSEKYIIHHEFDDEGLIIGKYLMNKETSGGSSFK